MTLHSSSDVITGRATWLARYTATDDGRSVRDNHTATTVACRRDPEIPSAEQKISLLTAQFPFSRGFYLVSYKLEWHV